MDKCLEEGLIVTMKSCSLGNEFLLHIQQLLSDLEKDEDNISFTQIWLQVNVMFVFQHYLFGNLDKKTLKRLTDINKKVKLIYKLFIVYLLISTYTNFRLSVVQYWVIRFGILKHFYYNTFHPYQKFLTQRCLPPIESPKLQSEVRIYQKKLIYFVYK